MRYATLEDLQSAIEKENQERGSYLSERDKQKLWTVTNPSQVSEILASAREKALGGEVCKNRRKDVDKYARDSDINTLDYYTCPGDDPEISIERENKVTRLAYQKYPVYPSSVPLGLTSQVMGVNPMSESYPPSIPLINMAQVSVPYGLTSMATELVKQIPPGFYM
jgi:hypothetical protein